MSEHNPWSRPQDPEQPEPPAETVSLSKPAASPTEPMSAGVPVNLEKPFAAPDGATSPLPPSVVAPGAQPPPADAPTGYFAPGAPPVGYPPYPSHQAPGYGPPTAGIYGDPGFGAASAGAAAPYTLDAYGMPVPARTDPMAIAALSVGLASVGLAIVSCCCCVYLEVAWVVLGLVAVGLGIVSYRQIGRDPYRLSGRNYAIWGMATGGAGAAIAIAGLIIIAGIGLFGGLQHY